MSPHAQQLAWEAARCLAGLLGLIFLYMALFMYQDERGRQQNRLVDLWISVRAREESTATAYVAFIRTCSELSLRGLHKLLGDRLLSLRTLVTSLSLSLCSSSLLLLAAHDSWTGKILSLLLSVAFGIYGFGIAPALFRRGRRRFAFSILLLILASYSFSFLGSNSSSSLNSLSDALAFSALLLSGVSFGLASDLLLLLINRFLLRAMTKTTRSILLVAGMAYNLSLSIFLADSVRFSMFSSSGYESSNDPLFKLINHVAEKQMIADDPVGSGAIATIFIVSYAFSTNLFTLLTSSSVVMVMLVALVHRFTWPVIGRTLNAIYAWEILSSRKVQFSAATAFLLFSNPHISTLFSLFK